MTQSASCLCTQSFGRPPSARRLLCSRWPHDLACAREASPVDVTSFAGATRWTATPRARRAATIGSGARSSLMTAVKVFRATERRKGRAAPLRAVDDGDDLPSGARHEALDLRFLFGRIAEARLERQPRTAQERLLDVDLLEHTVTQLTDDRKRLPANKPTGHGHGDFCGVASELRGNAQAVRDDRQLGPAAPEP